MKRLKQLREAYGLSQQKLAKHFHLSQQSIYKYENGLAEPGIATLKAFAAFFHTSIDFLVGYADKEKVPAQADCLKVTDTERCLLYHYRGLTPKMQRIVLELVRKARIIVQHQKMKMLLKTKNNIFLGHLQDNTVLQVACFFISKYLATDFGVMEYFFAKLTEKIHSYLTEKLFYPQSASRFPQFPTLPENPHQNLSLKNCNSPASSPKTS